MKEKQHHRKGLKWALLCAGVVLIAVIATLFALLSGPSEQAPVQQPEGKLYWNVDRTQYVAKGMNGASGRLSRDDGYYWVRFAVEGAQVDIPVESRSLVDKIDMLDLMSLTLDENGVVTDVIPAEHYAGGLAVDRLYVEAVDGNQVTCNTSGLNKGVSVTVEVPQSANVYNVGGEGLLVGMKGNIAVDDQMIAVQDEDGVISDVFVIPYAQEDNVYWNMVRKYDSSLKITTRETTLLGDYEDQMCHGGQIVTVKTKDRALAP